MTTLAFILAGLGFVMGMTAGVGFAISPHDPGYQRTMILATCWAVGGALLLGASWVIMLVSA